MLYIYYFISAAYFRAAAAVNGKCNSMHSFNVGNQSESTPVRNNSRPSPPHRPHAAEKSSIAGDFINIINSSNRAELSTGKKMDLATKQ